LESRMCPASPQSITGCAMLIPVPATLVRSFPFAMADSDALLMPG
jgi:hypothetical protein